jgi:thymidylate synthase
MSNYDTQYADLVRNIIDYGYSDEGENVRPRWADGTPAHTLSLISEKISFTGNEVPILTTKRVAWKTAIHELLWFYVKRTSDVSYLKENNVKIWDEWTREDGTIGKAYGYQLGKTIKVGHYNWSNQVHNLIDQLKSNPASRRHIISLWNIDDLHDMALYPCVWHNQWLVKEGKLHLIVGIRSNDVALGQPFNVFQYYVLQRMVAQVTGYEIGTLTFNINDAHIYTRHIEGLKEQIEREPYPAPTLLINPDIKNFDDFRIDDFQLVDYKCHPTIDFEVAI